VLGREQQYVLEEIHTRRASEAHQERLFDSRSIEHLQLRECHRVVPLFVDPDGAAQQGRVGDGDAEVWPTEREERMEVLAIGLEGLGE